MNIDQLKYFADLAKTSSINTTAKRMFISQQALSESVKRLEKELDCTLLTRSKTGIAFTEDGKIVLETAQNILEQYQTMLEALDAKHQREHLKGIIHLGIAPAATGSFLPELLMLFQTHYPDITLYIQEHPADQLFLLLDNETIDFAIFNYTEDEIDEAVVSPDQMLDVFTFDTLYNDYLVCAMAKNNPLSTLPSIAMEALLEYKTTRYANNSFIKPESNCVHVSNNTAIHQQFMREEGTFCCMPQQLFLTLYSRKEFHWIPIEGAKPVICSLAYKKGASSSTSAIGQTFIQAVHSVIPKI